VALRRVPQRFFGVFMSINPVIAALAGIVLLGQVLELHEWLGIAIVVAANVVAVSTTRARPVQEPVEEADAVVTGAG
jgi:inner membrane transporter RhtA